LADQIKEESPMIDVLTKKVARLEQERISLKNHSNDLEAELLAKNAEISSVLSGIEGVKSRIKIVQSNVDDYTDKKSKVVSSKLKRTKSKSS